MAGLPVIWYVATTLQWCSGSEVRMAVDLKAMVEALVVSREKSIKKLDEDISALKTLGQTATPALAVALRANCEVKEQRRTRLAAELVAYRAQLETMKEPELPFTKPPAKR